MFFILIYMYYFSLNLKIEYIYMCKYVCKWVSKIFEIKKEYDKNMKDES